MKRIKTIALFLIGLLALTYFTGCVERGFDENSDITVISRWRLRNPWCLCCAVGRLTER